MPKKIIFYDTNRHLVLAGCNLFPVAPTAAPVANQCPPAETQTPIIIIVMPPRISAEVPTDTPVALSPAPLHQ